jgi:hypothetical protein
LEVTNSALDPLTVGERVQLEGANWPVKPVVTNGTVTASEGAASMKGAATIAALRVPVTRGLILVSKGLLIDECVMDGAESKMCCSSKLLGAQARADQSYMIRKPV